jgi:hypothetical protein
MRRAFPVASISTKLILTLALGLAGCASQPSGYLRTDGRAADPAQMQAVLAQCQAEGATSVSDHLSGDAPVPWIAGMVSRSNKETTVVKGCMARNGYLAQ